MIDKINAWFAKNGKSFAYFMAGAFTIMALNEVVAGNYLIAVFNTVMAAANLWIARTY